MASVAAPQVKTCRCFWNVQQQRTYVELTRGRSEPLCVRRTGSHRQMQASPLWTLRPTRPTRGRGTLSCGLVASGDTMLWCAKRTGTALTGAFG